MSLVSREKGGTFVSLFRALARKFRESCTKFQAGDETSPRSQGSTPAPPPPITSNRVRGSARCDTHTTPSGHSSAGSPPTAHAASPHHSHPPVVGSRAACVQFRYAISHGNDAGGWANTCTAVVLSRCLHAPVEVDHAVKWSTDNAVRYRPARSRGAHMGFSYPSSIRGLQAASGQRSER